MFAPVGNWEETVQEPGTRLPATQLLHIRRKGAQGLGGGLFATLCLTPLVALMALLALSFNMCGFPLDTGALATDTMGLVGLPHTMNWGTAEACLWCRQVAGFMSYNRPGTLMPALVASELPCVMWVVSQGVLDQLQN